MKGNLLAVSTSGPILFFDGICNLCNHFVQFLLKHEKDPSIRFATLQSELGKEAKRMVSDQEASVDSIIFLIDGVVYVKSTAALEIAAHLSSPYHHLKHFHIVPRFIRDRIYDIIARYRYRLFGKRDQCIMPRPELRGRFL